MLISPNNSILHYFHNSHRDISRAQEGNCKNRNGQSIVSKRNYPFQRSYLHICPADTDTNIYNVANKVEPLKINHMGLLIDIYA